MLRQNPGDPETRWAAARAEHRVANILARSPRSAEAEPAYRAAHQNLTLLLAEDPRRLEYRQECGRCPRRLGVDEARRGRRGQDHPPAGPGRASAARLGVPRRVAVSPEARAATASRWPGRSGSSSPPRPRRRKPSSAGPWNFARPWRIARSRSRAELAESLAYLGHLLNATRSPARRGRGHGSRPGPARGPGVRILRRPGPVAIGSSCWISLFRMPRYCDPRATRRDAGGPANRRWRARPGSWPSSRSSRSSGRRWPGPRWPGGHAQDLRPTGRGRGRPAKGRRDLRGAASATIPPWTTTAAGPPERSSPWAP